MFIKKTNHKQKISIIFLASYILYLINFIIEIFKVLHVIHLINSQKNSAFNFYGNIL